MAIAVWGIPFIIMSIKAETVWNKVADCFEILPPSFWNAENAINWGACLPSQGRYS